MLRVTAWDRYLRGLAGSWRGFAAGRPCAEVVEAPGLLALRHPDPVFANAVLLAADALPRALALSSAAPSSAVWTRADDAETTGAVHRAGLHRDVVTTPMVRSLDLPLPDVALPVELDADPARVCRLNGVDPDLLTGVPGLRCVATADDTAVLVVQDVGDDAVLSFVTTHPTARGRGLATAVTAAALHDAVRRGRTGAVLQATPAAQGLYTRLGFVAVGRWQEWVPAARSSSPDARER